ncbi:ribonuclease H2 subunit A [Diachasma alloeum]|uniref:ribonuclease H2 subunit A n=1 Tax=Diachasma alloeum TaxID=454923 RepID=UPI00073813A3|nr:ribonuclease H2 subunit A [Diachasma alloeum]
MEEDKENSKVETTEAEKSTRITRRGDLTPFFEKSDHSINQIHQTEVPQICKDEPCQLGVDEAGRGPVLGPMVYGIAYAPLSKKQLLVDLGCADSKTLTEEKRDEIFDKICDKHEEMGWMVEAISPNIIANSMYRRSKTSLNEVSMNSAIGLIRRAIEAGANIAEVYVDTVGKPEKYEAKLKAIFPDIGKIVVAKKADSTYPIVSAASICAKVSRDHALRAWKFREGSPKGDYGSGYPNDPVTKKWMSENVDPIFGYPQIVRFSWSTAETIVADKAVEVEWENVDDDDVKRDAKEQKISKFFAKVERERHEFFVDRCLSATSEF